MPSDPTQVPSAYRDDERLQAFIGPGGPFEVESIEVDGVALRDFVRAPRTVLDLFEMGAAHTDLVNLVLGDERITFGEVRAQALSLARELESGLGVQQGDRVAIAMRNLPEFVVAVWASVLVGAVAVPLNSWWTGPEMAHALDDAGATVAFLDGDRLTRLDAHGRPQGMTVIGARTDDGDIRFDDLASGAPIAEDDIVRTDPDDPIILLYTSGTTGRPKGALSTNRAMLANIWNMAFANMREAIIAERPPAPPGQLGTLMAGPLFHIGGMSSIFGAPMGGLKVILMPRWDVEEAVRLAELEQITSFGGVPAMVRQVLDLPGVGDRDLNMRGFPMGGSAIPPDLPIRAIETFGDGIQLYNGYGLTETTSAVVCNVGVEFVANPTSVGRPNLTTDVKVVGPDEDELPNGAVGEICFRSPQVVRGYWNNPAATAESFVDGWFHTGDLGYLDDEGFLYVVDRLKDVVIRGGENVYCAEVEAVLYEHAAVAAVAVVGIDEEAMGERVCAVIVLRNGRSVDLDEIRRFASERIAGFKVPEAMLVATDLPETATSKLDKKAIRRHVADNRDEVVITW